MADTYLKLNTRKTLVGGKHQVQVAVGHGTGLYISTGFSCTEEEWDNNLGQFIGRNMRNINAYLQAFTSRIVTRLMELRLHTSIKNMEKKALTEYLCAENADLSKISTPIIAFKDILEECAATKDAERTRELYYTTLKRISEFTNINTLSFDMIDVKWLRKFDEYLKKNGSKQNSRNIHFRNIRAVFNYALDMDIDVHYPFRQFKLKYEETRKRSLSLEDLRRFFNADTDEAQKQYLDMFKLTFFLIGINLVDLVNLKPKDLINGRVEYKRAKTGKLYSIKVEPEAMEIIDKYKGVNYLIDIGDRYRNYHDYTKKINDNLKRIGDAPTVETLPVNAIAGKIYTSRDSVSKKIFHPFFPDISLYWARHTWATIAANELDVPIDTISAALGHSYGSRITNVYIRPDEKKVDLANRRVIDLVLYGKK